MRHVAGAFVVSGTLLALLGGWRWLVLALCLLIAGLVAAYVDGREPL